VRRLARPARPESLLPLLTIPVEPGSEKLLLGPLTFHDLALVIGGSFSIIAIFLSLYLAFMHAVNYTKPDEQRQYVPAASPP
ncbi:OSTA/TMEM184 family protein, partial [Candidatus Bathyarchaeota archaeon]|nr:OSTA/TMEM184 family protein [Candidatus Bathyarchaeota archaeon]